MTVHIETGVIAGELPRRALKLVLEWFEPHRDELRMNWLLAEQGEPLRPIPPLQ